MFDLEPCFHCSANYAGLAGSLGGGSFVFNLLGGGAGGGFFGGGGSHFDTGSNAGVAPDEIVVTGSRGNASYADGLINLDLSGGLTGQNANYAYLGPLGPVIMATRVRPRSDSLFGVESSASGPAGAAGAEGGVPTKRPELRPSVIGPKADCILQAALAVGSGLIAVGSIYALEYATSIAVFGGTALIAVGAGITFIAVVAYAADTCFGAFS